MFGLLVVVVVVVVVEQGKKSMTIESGLLSPDLPLRGNAGQTQNAD